MGHVVHRRSGNCRDHAKKQKAWRSKTACDSRAEGREPKAVHPHMEPAAMQKRIGKRRPPLRLPIAQEKGRRFSAELAVVRDRIEGQGHGVWSERESKPSRHEGEAPKNLKI